MKGRPELKTGEKRKDHKVKESQPKPKKRRKLMYPTLSEDWGAGIGEDISRMEDEEMKRKSLES